MSHEMSDEEIAYLCSPEFWYELDLYIGIDEERAVRELPVPNLMRCDREYEVEIGCQLAARGPRNRAKRKRIADLRRKRELVRAELVQRG